MGQRIRIRGVGGKVEGQTWESDSLLRIGRLSELEVVIEDSSVSRNHAEIRPTPMGWRIRDLGSTNGTFVNGKRVTSGEWPLNPRDIVRCGSVNLMIDDVFDGEEPACESPTLADNLLVEYSQSRGWEEAFEDLIYASDRSPRPGEELLVLLRAGHHLGSSETEDELLHSILNDAVSTLDAQRGAIVLAQGPEGPLKLRAVATGRDQLAASRTNFSHSLAWRCFSQGESILCTSVEEDPELAGARSIAEGTMASVMCVLLRTPRRRLGVLHLDRGPFQAPFTKEDLHLADALAASVSAGIESAALLERQKLLLYQTISVLAQAVELRDAYTGNHTARVTTYAEMLGQELGLSTEQLHWIRIGTPLHDIGKIGIDDAILRKPGRLTRAEFEVMKTHTTKGADILSQVPDLEPVVPIARSHHERWDGKGYPDGLKGEETPLLARIVAVADAFDAMTSDRPYRVGMPAEVAFEEVNKQKGKQFDPECAVAFLAIADEVVERMHDKPQRLVSPLTTTKGTIRLVPAG